MENDEKKDEGQAQATDTSQGNGSDGSPEATGKTINISGQSFTVSDELAQAYSGHTQDIDRRFDERSQELGRLRQVETDTLQREQEAQEATNKQKQPDLSTLMYEDPGEFVNLIRQENQKQIDGLRTEYQQAESTKKEEASFWNSMWAENKDLALIKTQAQDVLKMVGQKYAHMNPPNTKEVRDAYAKETRQWLKDLVGTNANGDTNAYIEGGSETTPTTKKKTEEKPRKTTKQIYDQRREKKRKAMAERT